jgi:hypothetical protein
MVQPETVQKQYENGLPPQAIANQYGVDASEIQAIIDDNDFEKQPCNAKDPEWLQEKLNEGYPPSRITVLGGVRSTTAQVRDVIREHDLDTSNTEPAMGRGERTLNGVVERDTVYTDDEWRDSGKLYRAYWEYYWSIGQIAEWCDTTRHQVSTYINDECEWDTRDSTTANYVRLMKVRGEPIEQIRDAYPYPDDEDESDADTETESKAVTWSDIS